MRVLRGSNIEEFMLSIACRVQFIKNVKMSKFQFEIKLPKSNYLKTRSKDFLFSIS